MKFLFISWRDLSHPNAGGSEVVVDRLIMELARRGHESALICGGPIEPRPYPVVDAGGTFGQYLKAPWLARRYRDYDVLVDVVNGVGFNSPLWWRGPRMCFFHHVHNEQWRRHFPPLVARAGWFAERELLPRLYRTTEFVTISPSTAHDLQEIGVRADQIHLVHIGLDDELVAEPGALSPEPLFVVLGRLQPNKGVDRVLDAWAKVQPVIGGRLVIIGEGPERAALEARGLPGVEWPGRVSDEEKQALLGSAWLLVHGAHREGWGIVIIEAAAQRTPAIAFDGPGVRDAIVDGETGVLAADVSGFAESWVELSRDTERRLAMGEAARQRAAGFTWSAAADDLLDAADVAIELSRSRRGS